MVSPANPEVAEAYELVLTFSKVFGQQVMDMFSDDNAPTYPMIVVKDFEKLIKMPAGSRPIRTSSGLDFGYQALNDATETIRKQGLEAMGISEWDGPASN